MLALLLAHAAALAAFWWLPDWAARRDAALFTANPASDDFHRVFHRQRLLERAGIFAAVLLLSGVAAQLSGVTPYIPAAGLLAAGAGLWAYRFNPLLNRYRALPYVGPWYVSPDPRAAWFPDRLLWRKTLRAVPTGALNDAELYAARRTHAATALRTLLAVALVAGLAGEAAGLAVVLL